MGSLASIVLHARSIGNTMGVMGGSPGCNLLDEKYFRLACLNNAFSLKNYLKIAGSPWLSSLCQMLFTKVENQSAYFSNFWIVFDKMVRCENNKWTVKLCDQMSGVLFLIWKALNEAMEGAAQNCKDLGVLLLGRCRTLLESSDLAEDKGNRSLGRRLSQKELCMDDRASLIEDFLALCLLHSQFGIFCELFTSNLGDSAAFFPKSEFFIP